MASIYNALDACGLRAVVLLGSSLSGLAVRNPMHVLDAVILDSYACVLVPSPAMASGI